jgi:gamma-butyrobetaine dioxygenase
MREEGIVTRTTVECDARGLFVVVPGQGPDARSSKHYFNYLWLRDNCPTSWSLQTKDRVFDIFSQPLELKPKSATVKDANLIVEWAFDGHTSKYDLDWLIRWSMQPGRDDPADIPQHRWYGDHAFARFHDPELKRSEVQQERLMTTLLREGVAIVESVPDSDQALTQLAEVIGSVRASFSGAYFDVKAKPDPRGVAYTAHALEPHTDSPCEEMPPGVQFLHCRINTTKGGESTLADGAAVAEELRKSHPRDFDLLTSVSIPFRFHHTGLDMRARQRVIEIDRRGTVTGVTISQHIADIFDLDQTLLDEFYPAFCRFGAMLRNARFSATFLLRAGDCMIFDNHRIVHGRLAYDRQSGERYLRGCYTDRGELRSKYRTIRSIVQSPSQSNLQVAS